MSEAAGEDPLRIVLVSPRNPLNIGAAARAMSNFGLRKLRLVNPYDAAFREARSAVKSGYILQEAEVFDKLSNAIADCRLIVGTTAAERRDLHAPLYRLEAGAREIKANAKPVALLFGSEKFGLSNEDISFCHWLMRIPTRSAHGSMNLGQAVAICLYELHREDSAASCQYPQPERAQDTDYDRFASLLTEILTHSGYTHPRTYNSTELKLRRLVRRLALPGADAKNWLGILRQILWKVRGGETNTDAILNRDDEGSDDV